MLTFGGSNWIGEPDQFQRNITYHYIQNMFSCTPTQGFAVDADSPSLCSRRRSGAELREGNPSIVSQSGFSPRGNRVSPTKQRPASVGSSGKVLASPYWVEPGLSMSSGQGMATVY